MEGTGGQQWPDLTVVYFDGLMPNMYLFVFHNLVNGGKPQNLELAAFQMESWCSLCALNWGPLQATSGCCRGQEVRTNTHTQCR